MSTNVKYYQLLQQISDANPFKRSLAPRCFDLAADFSRDMELLAANRNWSAEGRRSEAQKYLRRSLRDLRDLQTPVHDHRARTETMRAQVRGPVFDKSDVVGALLRRELRDRACAMSPGQRHALMTGPRRSTAFLDALLEFADDPWMSGIDNFAPDQQEIFRVAREERLRDLHAPLMDEISQRESVRGRSRDGHKRGA